VREERKSRTGHFGGKGHNLDCEGYDGRSSSLDRDSAVLLPIRRLDWLR
jgi:hypothetical protein